MKHIKFKITTPLTKQEPVPDDMLAVQTKSAKYHWELYEITERLYHERYPAPGWDKDWEQHHNSCKQDAKAMIKAPKPTPEEDILIEDWRVNHARDPRYQYHTYNHNVAKLHRPTVVAYVSFVTWMGLADELDYSPEAEVGSRYFKTGRKIDRWSDNNQELCLMSNNEIWFYFGDQKRESQKRKPKFLEEIKALIRAQA